MIIEIPDDDSIVKWKMNDNDEWKSAEISDLIKAYDRRQTGDSISRNALREDFDVAFFNDEDDYKKALRIIDSAQAVEDRYSEGYAQGYIDGSTGADWRGDTE